MLSYQHGYHAGNFADLVKHLTLSRLLHYMISKDKPLFYLETHAGKGLYDLQDEQALKTGEACEGIKRLWAERKQLPSVFSPYLEQISALNHGEKNLRYYPGSPYLAMQMLRKEDRLFCAEWHPQEFEALKHLGHRGKRITYSHSDGLLQLKALLPPPERRGLIFMDPSYEIKTEYRDLPLAIKLAYQRFATGVYCLWYPIVDKKLHAKLLRGLNDIDVKNHLRVEFYLTKALKPGMTGCGLWIINPPYLLASELKLALNSLSQIIEPGVSSYLIEPAS